MKGKKGASKRRIDFINITLTGVYKKSSNRQKNKELTKKKDHKVDLGGV